jgi:adenosyl cobinamide kinase/adenosyl cobinamide phosphate guanylyltransferase
MHRASDMRAREQEFLWHGRLPVGHMTVVAGSPRMGKSTLGYRIAADTDVPTLFVSTEEVSETVWLPRLLAAGANPDKAWHHPEIRFSRNPLDLARLLDLVDQYGIRLIVVDPVQNHLDCSPSHDQSVRTVMEPYLQALQRAKVALLLEAHVLRGVKADADPLLAFPSGLRGWAKAAYLFGKDPTLGADPDMRILAAAKFNFGKEPASRRFEFATDDVSVIRAKGGGRVTHTYGMWIDRGEVPVSAKALLVTLTPESKERMADRVAWELISFLHTGEDGRMQPVTAVKQWRLTLDPPTSWRTVERVAKELGIERIDDPANKSKKWWVLSDDLVETMDVAESQSDVIIQEIDIDIPDAPPADWTSDDDA